MTAIADASIDPAGQVPDKTAAPALPLWLLKVVVGYFVVAKILYAVVVPPNGDESYYWIWGLHPQISYLDHAPLVGWGSFLSMHLFGWTPFALHVVPLLGTAVMILTFRLWARYLTPANPAYFFWASTAVFFASPLMLILSTLLYPDQLLMPISLLAMTSLAIFLADYERGTARWRYLYLGAALIGFAILSKYNGAVVGAGLLFALIVRPKLRPLFKAPQLYLAGVIAALFLIPIILWSVGHGFDSVKLHAVNRFENRGSGFGFGGVKSLLIQTALDLSPLLLWPLFRFVTARRLGGFAGSLHAVALGMFLASTIATTALASWNPAAGQVVPHWNIMGLLPVAAMAAFFIRSRWYLAATLGLGAIVAGAAVLYYVLCPLPADALGIADGEAVVTFGLDDVYRAAHAAQIARHADFIGTLSYSSAGQLAFGAGSGDGIISVSPALDQYDLWYDQDALKGKTAVMMVQWPGQDQQLSQLFDHVEKIGDVNTERLGHKLWTFGLYLGTGFHGGNAP